MKYCSKTQKKPGIIELEFICSVILTAFVATLPYTGTSQPMAGTYVDGYVTGKPENNHPYTTVIAFDKATGIPFDTAYTDVTGYYHFENLPVGVRHSRTTIDDALYPNSYENRTNIEVEAPSEHMYQLIMSRIGDGVVVLNKNVKLEKGANRLTLKGGEAGNYIIRLLGETDVHTFKAIQTAGDGGPINVDVGRVDESRLKSTASADSLLITYTSPGFIPTDTTVMSQPTMHIDKDIWQIPNTLVNTIYKPFDVNGNPANITLTIDWPDGTSGNYPTNSNGEIHIQKYLYVTSAVGVMELDSVAFPENQTYLGWTIGRKVHQPTNVANLFQNPKESGTATQNNPPQPTPVDFSDSTINLQNGFNYLYVVPKKVPDPTGEINDSIRMDSETVRHIMALKNGGKITHFIDVDDVPTWIPMYKIQNARDGSTNQPIPVVQLDRALALTEMTDTLKYIPNTGDTILPQFVFHRMENYLTDSIWQAIQARGDEQYTNTSFATVVFNNSFFEYSNTHTYNGEDRTKNSNSLYKVSDSDARIFAAYYSAMTTTKDPTTFPGSLINYVYKNNAATKLAETMLRTICILELGTKYY